MLTANTVLTAEATDRKFNLSIREQAPWELDAAAAAGDSVRSERAKKRNGESSLAFLFGIVALAGLGMCASVSLELAVWIGGTTVGLVGATMAGQRMGRR